MGTPCSYAQGARRRVAGMRTPGCIELTWNYGSEQEDGRVYNTGNSDAVGSPNGEKVRGGFGHLGITVPDVYAASERFAKLGYEFTKTPNSGGTKPRNPRHSGIIEGRRKRV